MVKEMSWFKDIAQTLEKLKIIHLDPEVIAEQLYEQKVRILNFKQMIYLLCLYTTKIKFKI